MGSGGGGCSRRTGPPRARSVSGPRSRASRRSPGRPPSPPPPPSRPWRRRTSWSRICATGLGARVLGERAHLLALRGAHHVGGCWSGPLRDQRPRTPAALWRCWAPWSRCFPAPSCRSADSAPWPLKGWGPRCARSAASRRPSRSHLREANPRYSRRGLLQSLRGRAYSLFCEACMTAPRIVDFRLSPRPNRAESPKSRSVAQRSKKGRIYLRTTLCLEIRVRM